MEFNNVIEVTEYFSDKQKCIDYLIEMRWGGKVTCPHCNHGKVYELKGKHKRYKCSSCQKQFSILKGTYFEHSRIPLQKWFIATYLVVTYKKGISSIQLAKHIGVAWSTAWFMKHRIIDGLGTDFFDPLDGVIQCDETYVGGKNKNRVGKRKIPNSQGRSLKDKTPVFGMLKVGGQVRTVVVPDTKASTIQPIIESVITAGSMIITDEWKAYKKLPDKYFHVVLNHDTKEYVRGGFHNNSIEGFWSILKRGIIGVFHWLSPKYLHRYCNEFSFRYNMRHFSDYVKYNTLIKKVTNGRLLFKQLTRNINCTS